MIVNKSEIMMLQQKRTQKGVGEISARIRDLSDKIY